MHILTISFLVGALASIAQGAVLQSWDLLQNLQDQALQNLRETQSNSSIAKRGRSLSTAAVRRDW